MVGIRDYPIKRVIATSRDVFDVSGSDSEWDRALPALEEAGFVRVKTVASTLELTNDVYLDLAVPALAGDHSQIAAAWLRLKGSLEGERDWKPLARLGDMFRRQEDTQNAEKCYRAALGGFSKDSDPDAWAFAQLGLGLILLVKIEESAESQRAPLLEEAKNAFQGTLAVVTPESDSAVWAEASAGLATVYRTEAALGLEALLRQGSPTTRQRRIRGQALESALTESRDALKVLRKDSTPEEWAEAEYQLGLVHYVTALLSGDLRDRRTKLDTAIEAQRRALSVYTDTDHPIKVARVERAMGDACKLRAEASIRPRKDELLNQAVSSYKHAIDISTARQLWSGAEMATIRTQLASCFRGLAILSEEPRRSEFLESAADLYRVASQAFDQQTSYVNRAEALRDLGQTLSDLAVLADTERMPSLWNESQVAFTDAFETLGGRGTRTLRAQLHLGLASIYWQRASSTDSPSPSDIVQAFGNASRAQNSFPAGEHATEINQATKIARDAARKAQELKIPLPGNGDISSSRNQRAVS
jgi:tetratricopeptide (TPR) repeat protein